MIQSILVAVLPCQFWFGDISRIVVTHYVATSRFFEKPAFHIYDFHNDFPKDFLLNVPRPTNDTTNHQTYHFCKLFWNSNWFLLWMCDNYIPGYLHDVVKSLLDSRRQTLFYCNNDKKKPFSLASAILPIFFKPFLLQRLLSRSAPPSYGAPPPPAAPAPVYAGPSQDSYRL